MKLFSFLRPDELHQEISEELRFHIEMKTEDLIRNGLPPAEARQAAEKSFGSVSRVAEAGHDVRGLGRLGDIYSDIRFALRLLGKRPVRTAVLIATLSLGIGANTAVFGVVHSLLLQPLPFRDAERLVVLHQANHGASSGVSYPHFQDWRNGNRIFLEMAVFGTASATLTGQGEPLVVLGATASSSLFRVLGVQPIRGRLLEPAEDRRIAGAKAAMPILISDRLWRSRFNERESALGKLIHLDGREYNIVGIIPSEFGYPMQKDPIDYWTTVAVDADPALYGGTILTSRGYPRYDGVVARLKPGVNLAQARGEMTSLAQTIAREHPHTTSADDITVTPALEDVLGSGSKLMVLLLYGAVTCVLLVACVNIATVLLVDVAARRREFSLRSALGASVHKLVRQLLVEAAVLGFGGCLVSLLVSPVAVSLFVALAPPETPRLQEIRLDSWAFLYTPAISLVASLLFGCLPALSIRGRDLAAPLKEASYSVTGRASGLRAGPVLISGQIALSMVLTCSATMLVVSFDKILHSPRGFNPQRLLTASISLPVSAYGQSSKRVENFYNSLLQNVRSMPGVESATSAEVLPLSGRSNATTVEVGAVHEPAKAGVDLRFVDSNYFATLQIPLRIGRLFTNQDIAGRPACAIVNEAFVRRFLQGQDPQSTELRLGWGGNSPKRIVGVVSDIRPTATSPATNPEVYVPYAQFPLNDMSILIRSTGDPNALAASLGATVRRLDATVPLDRVRSLESYLLLSSAPQRFLMWLLVSFALMTTTLSAVGVYGVLNDSTSARTQEFGIRMALGATTWRLVRLVLQQCLILAVAGLVVGGAMTVASSRFLERWLYDAGSLTAGSFAMSAGVLLVVVLAACWIPCRRAASVDPSQSLRMS